MSMEKKKPTTMRMPIRMRKALMDRSRTILELLIRITSRFLTEMSNNMEANPCTMLWTIASLERLSRIDWIRYIMTRTTWCKSWLYSKVDAISAPSGLPAGTWMCQHLTKNSQRRMCKR
jgi:hypothetical protein